CDEFRVAPDGTAAYGTFAVNVSGEIERSRIARPLGFHNFNDSGNHFACFFDHDGVTNPDVFAFDFVLVVQRRTRNGAPANQDRLQRRHRREDSGASDLNDDVVQARLYAFRRVFVSDRPALRFVWEPPSHELPACLEFNRLVFRLARRGGLGMTTYFSQVKAGLRKKI